MIKHALYITNKMQYVRVFDSVEKCMPAGTAVVYIGAIIIMNEIRRDILLGPDGMLYITHCLTYDRFPNDEETSLSAFWFKRA